MPVVECPPRGARRTLRRRGRRWRHGRARPRQRSLGRDVVETALARRVLSPRPSPPARLRSQPARRSRLAVDAQDVAGLLGDGAHLVGFSYGGVVSLLAAARRPHAVRSLVVIERGALAVAPEHPAVAELLGRRRAVYGRFEPDARGVRRPLRRGARVRPRPAGLDPETRSVLDAIRRERPPWEAEMPLAEPAAADALRRLLPRGR